MMEENSSVNPENPFLSVNQLGLRMQGEYLEAVRQERDGDDEILLELTDEQKKDTIEECDRFFDWFLNLSTVDALSTINFGDDCPPYPAEDVKITLFSPEASVSWLTLYKGGKSIDEIAQDDAINRDVVILGVVEAIWREENMGDTNLASLLSAVQADKVLIRQTREFLSPGMQIERSPKRLCHKLLLCPSDVSVILLLVRADLSGWPLSINWEDVQLEDYSMKDIQQLLDPLDTLIHEQFSDDNTESSRIIDEHSAFLEESENFFKKLKNEMDAVHKEVEKLAEGMDSMKEQQALEIQLRNAATNSLYVDNLSSSPPRNEEEIAEFNEEMDAIQTVSDNIHIPDTKAKETLNINMLTNFNSDAAVLVRREPYDGEPFTDGKVIKKLDENRYQVLFVSSGEHVAVELADIAHPNMIYTEDYPEGFRVAAKVRKVTPRSNKVTVGYFSGTISNRPTSIHNNQYLIFFDADFDEYVNREDIKVMARQPAERGLIDKGMAHTFIRNSPKKKMFVEMYFRSYPDWGLVRLKKNEANQRIAVRNCSGEQWSAIVLEVDRHMCLLRFPPLANKSAQGANCVVKDCRQHFHIDERLYRGSDRFHQVQQNIDNHSGSNVIVGRQLARHRATLESAVPVSIHIEMDKEIHKKPTARKSTMPLGREPSVPGVVHVEQKKKENVAVLRRRMHKFELVEHPIEPLVTVDPVYHANCTSDCLKGIDRDPSDPMYFSESPFHIPLLCGWRRIIYDPLATGSSRNTSQNRPYLVYRGPCGKPLYDMQQIGEYLKDTCCEMTIDLFTFDVDVRTHVIAKVDVRDQVLADFAQGNEGMPVPAVNSVDKDATPQIIYSARRFAENEEVDISTVKREFCSGCTCTDDCQDETRCECQQLTRSLVKRLARDLRPQGALNYRQRRIVRRVQSGIYECNDSCGCNRKRCYNRVVQQPIKIPLQLFKTAECGWGVRTLVDLPRGCFIANYNGAILSDTLADNLKDRGDEYFADLDLIDSVEQEKENRGIDLLDDKGVADLQGESEEETRDDSSDGYVTDEDREGAEKRESVKEVPQAAGFGAQWSMASYFGDQHLFIVDAKKRGNIGRFLNHSCDPNVYVQHVFVDTHDLRLPWVSFFTMKNVKAGEELRWDYAYTVDDSEGVRMVCCCGAKNCRLRLL